MEQHAVRSGRIGFAQRPGCLIGEICVGCTKLLANGVECLVNLEQAARHCFFHLRKTSVQLAEQLLFGFGRDARFGNLAFAIFGNHRQAALRQIAEIIGEIGIGLGHDGFC